MFCPGLYILLLHVLQRTWDANDCAVYIQATVASETLEAMFFQDYSVNICCVNKE